MTNSLSRHGALSLNRVIEEIQVLIEEEYVKSGSDGRKFDAS